jgi:hypothetical protein
MDAAKNMDAQRSADWFNLGDRSRYPSPAWFVIIRFPQPPHPSGVRKFKCGPAEQRNEIFYPGTQCFDDLLFSAYSCGESPDQTSAGRSRKTSSGIHLVGIFHLAPPGWYPLVATIATPLMIIRRVIRRFSKLSRRGRGRSPVIVCSPEREIAKR